MPIDPKFNTDQDQLHINFNSSNPPIVPEFNSDGTLKLTTTENEQVVPITFSSNPQVNLDFGSVVMIDKQGGEKNIYYGSTEYWNNQPRLIAERGCLYIYRDWKTLEDGKLLAGIKIGDGSSYLIDMPFTDEIWQEHVDDMIIHITQEEREFWNNKVRCYIDNIDGENLIFTTH